MNRHDVIAAIAGAMLATGICTGVIWTSPRPLAPCLDHPAEVARRGGDAAGETKGFAVEDRIEPDLQVRLLELLSNAVIRTKCESANAVVVEHRSERVLAMAGVPEFDPPPCGTGAKKRPVNRCVVSLEVPGSLITPLLDPQITNDCAIVHDRLVRLGFGMPVRLGHRAGRVPFVPLRDPGDWTERYHRGVLAGQAILTTTLQLAIAFSRSAKESRAVPRAQSSPYCHELGAGPFTNTVNFLEVTGTDKTLVLAIRKPASNPACRRYLRALQVECIMGE